MSAFDAANILSVCSKTVQRMIDMFLATGDVEPSKRKNGPDKELNEFEEMTLIQQIYQNPGIYLHELRDVVANTTGTSVHYSTICRTLKRLGFSRKKIHYIALQQSEAKRAIYMAEISAFQPEMLVWIDETGCDKRNMLRKYGYSIRGTPAHNFALRVGGKRYSAIPVMSMTGILDVYIYEAGVNGDVFIDFIRRTVLPLLMPFNGLNAHSVVILDNASIHHVAMVQGIINSVGALVKFLPPYSPDLMPLTLV